MALSVTDCNTINTAIIRETGRISPEIYSKVVRSTPWVAMTPRETLLDSMGIVQTTMMFERILPADDNETWVDQAPSGQSGITNQCLPPVEILKWGQTLATWRLQKIAKQSEDLCIEDLRTAFQLQKVMEKFITGFRGVTQWVWENRDRNEYIRMCAHKVTEAAGGNYDLTNTTWDATKPPTSVLTWGTLRQIYSFLIRDGAGSDAVGQNSGGAPVFGLFTDENTRHSLMIQDPTARDDFRFAFEGKGTDSPLIAPLFDTQYSFNGFKLMNDFFPQRFEIVNSAYVRVMPFKAAEATTSGYMRNINPAYIYATYQATPIHVPTVYTQRVPIPLSTAGGGTKFDPVSYTGDFTWKNIPNAVCNPDGTIGFFRAVFASASEPVHPEYGWVVMAKNCPPVRRLITTCYDDVYH